MKSIIGIGHYSRVGKDTLANAIIDSLAERAPSLFVEKRPLARKLKEICHELYFWAGVREPDFYETEQGAKMRYEELTALGLSPVELWVEVGTNFFRKLHEDTWVNAILSKISCDVTIIPDVRWPNEFAAIRERDGLLVKVVRPGVPPLDTPADKALLGEDGWHLVVGGSGRISELKQWGDKIAKWCLGDKGAVRQTKSERERQLVIEGTK
jgi:hypothetical protein